MHKQVTVLFGTPGAGKSTLGKALKTVGFEVITTSDLLRKEIREGTPLGSRIKAFIEQGSLVPDETVLQVVSQYLPRYLNDAPLLLDGFPRTRLQADYFLHWARTVGADVYVLRLCIDPEIAIAESLQDKERNREREDNTRETMLHRFQVFEKETRPVIGELEEFFPGRIFTVDAQPGVRTKTAYVLSILGIEKDLSHLPDEPRGVNLATVGAS